MNTNYAATLLHAQARATGSNLPATLPSLMGTVTPTEDKMTALSNVGLQHNNDFLLEMQVALQQLQMEQQQKQQRQQQQRQQQQQQMQLLLQTQNLLYNGCNNANTTSNGFVPDLQTVGRAKNLLGLLSKQQEDQKQRAVNVARNQLINDILGQVYITNATGASTTLNPAAATMRPALFANMPTNSFNSNASRKRSIDSIGSSVSNSTDSVGSRSNEVTNLLRHISSSSSTTEIPSPRTSALLSPRGKKQRSSSTSSSTSKNSSKTGKMCSVEGCSTKDKGGGLCAKHGGGRPCKFAGCERIVAGVRYCTPHGGTRKKLCSKEGCTKGDQGGGFCASHGGGRRCQAVGCSRRDIGRGLCWSHGGGRRCGAPNCLRCPISGGFCKQHTLTGATATEPKAQV